jgi:hypothetical protein
VAAKLELGLLNHAEEIGVGVLQHDKVGILRIPPGIPCRANLDEPFHLDLLIVRVEVEVQSAALAGPLDDAAGRGYRLSIGT